MRDHSTPIPIPMLSQLMEFSQEIIQELDWDSLLSTMGRVILTVTQGTRLKIVWVEDRELTLVLLGHQDNHNQIKIELYPSVLSLDFLPEFEAVLDTILIEKQDIILTPDLIKSTEIRNPIPGVMGLPLQSSVKFWGFIYLEIEHPQAFNAEHQAILKFLIAQAVIALDKAEKYQNLTQYCQKIETDLDHKTQALEQAVNGYELAEERFYKAFLSNPNPITITRLKDGKHIEINDTFCELTGYTRPEIIGHTATELNLWVSAEARNQMFELLMQGHHIQNYEFEFRTKSQEVRTALLSAEIITLNGEQCLLALSNDITERKRAEEELKIAKEAADSANRAKSEFLASMSHELRTPLNAILGFTQLMNRDPSLLEEQRQNLAIINQSGEHLLELINDILEMSKIEAGRMKLNEDSFDLSRLLKTLEEMFQIKAKSQGLSLIFDIDPDTPLYIHADEGKLRQVLMNLLSNAIKFTEDGGVTLRVGIVPPEPETEPAPRCHLLFEVEDTGSGIAPEEIPSLFEAFVQTKTGIRSHSGTGLGLPISRKFVELMGGEFQVQSLLNQGSVFSFQIPVERKDAADIHTKTPTKSVIGLAPGQLTYRILAVDDRVESRLLLVKLLTSLGFEVREAENGQEAINIWQHWKPHLIFMDMRMPVMDGYEATQYIKTHLQGQATVIIALTASAFAEQRATVLSIGCDDFISKPFREDVLLAKIADHLGVRYRYHDTAITSLAPTNIPAPEPLTLQAKIHKMPAHWRETLHQAAIEGRERQMLQLIAQLADTDPIIADSLTHWVDNFEYDKIIQITETPP